MEIQNGQQNYNQQFCQQILRKNYLQGTLHSIVCSEEIMISLTLFSTRLPHRITTTVLSQMDTILLIQDPLQLDTLPMTIDEADPYELPNNDDEWMKEIDVTRDTDRMFAIDNTKKEQNIQTRNFDRKPKRNR